MLLYFTRCNKILGEGNYILGAARNFEGIKPLPLSKIAFSLFVTLFLTGTVSAAYTGSDFDWVEPLDVENTDFPTNICSSDGDSTGEDFLFEVNLDLIQDAGPYDGTLYLEKKDTSSTTWSNLHNVNVDSSYDPYNDYFVNKNQALTVNEDGSTTVTVNGNEHTFEVGGITSNGFLGFSIDGVNYESEASTEGEILKDAVEGLPIKITDNTGSQIEVTIYDKVRIPEGKTDYRWRFDPASGNDLVSIPFYANCDSERVPAPKAVSSDSLNVNPFSPYELTSGVQVGSNVVLNLSQKDDDDYNVTIYDGTDTQVGKIVRDGDLLKSGYVLDSVADVFSWQNSEDTLAFSPSSGFLSNDANQYDFYFEIVDNFGTTRYTPEYRVETSGSNDPPSIDAFEGYDGSSWKNINETNFGRGELEQIRVTVSDSNNDRHNAYLNLTNKYDSYYKIDDSYYTNQGSGTVYTWNLTSLDNADILDSGTWNATVSVSDGISSTKETRTWSLDWGDLSYSDFKVNGTSGNRDLQRYEKAYWNATLECSGGECASDNESVTLEYDPQPLGDGKIRLGKAVSTNPNVETEGLTVQKTSKSEKLFSLEYWRSWINEVLQ